MIVELLLHISGAHGNKANGTIELKNSKTHENSADLPTKLLGKKLHETHRAKMLQKWQIERTTKWRDDSSDSSGGSEDIFDLCLLGSLETSNK